MANRGDAWRVVFECVAKMEIGSAVALVTGANRGIGLAIVEALLQRGISRLYAGVREVKNVEGLVAQYGERVVPLPMDLQDPESLESAVEKSGEVSLLVNCGGVLHNSSTVSADCLAALETEFDVNVKGLLRLARAYAPILRSNGGGTLVQLNSVASIKCFPAFATYSASKAAAYSITQALRSDLASQGTRVISVHPGPIATRMSETAGFSEGAAPPEVVADAVLTALDTKDFHVFPDVAAKQLWAAYEWFAQAAIEAG